MKRKAKVMAMIYASVFPALAHLNVMVNSEKERRKMKEKDAKPISQLPGCRDDNPAPNTSVRGIIQKKSVFLRFMWGDSTLIPDRNYRFAT